MRITGIDIETFTVNHRETWVFVRVNTDEGLRGLGELNPSADRDACIAMLRRLEKKIAGEDPRHIERIVAAIKPPPHDRIAVHAMSAIEQGLWDILGKSLGVPVYTLLGGPCREEIRLYANVTRATFEHTPEAFARSAAGAVSDGFDVVKIAPFSGAGPIDRFEAAAHGIRCVHAVREAIGPDIGLMVDCYGLFTADCALRIAAALREADLFWFEEPVADEDVDGYRRVRTQCGYTVAGGERLMLRESYLNVMQHRMMDVIMPDVTIVGGIGELKKVAAMAEAAGIRTAPHGPFGPVAVAAGVQVMASHPAFMILEYAWGLTPERAHMVTPAETIENGRIRLSGVPGLGVSLA